MRAAKRKSRGVGIFLLLVSIAFCALPATVSLPVTHPALGEAGGTTLRQTAVSHEDQPVR